MFVLVICDLFEFDHIMIGAKKDCMDELCVCVRVHVWSLNVFCNGALFYATADSHRLTFPKITRRKGFV